MTEELIRIIDFCIKVFRQSVCAQTLFEVGGNLVGQKIEKNIIYYYVDAHKANMHNEFLKVM